MATQSPLDYVTAGMQATLKAPIINKTDDQVQAEQNAADTALKALEQRYANPNWFNIAAALFKPQLGGFAASLGSASQELGNWQEQQRANELPIYAARAQVGALKSQLKNRNDAAKEFEKAKAEGFSPDKLAALQARLSSLGANDLADSVNKMLEAQQKERTMSASEYSNAMNAAKAKFDAGGFKTKQDYANAIAGIDAQFGPKSRSSTTPSAKDESSTPGGDTQPLEAAAASTVAPPKTNVVVPPKTDAAAPATTTPEKVVLRSPYEKTVYDPETTKALAEADEKDARERFKNLSLAGAPEVNKRMITNADSLVDLVKNNKTLHDISFGLMQNKGNTPESSLWASIQAGLNKGIQFAVGNPLTANISVALPIEEMKKAGLDKTQINYVQRVSNLYARMKADQQIMSGVNPNSVSNYEANLYSLLTPNADNTSDSAINLAHHHKIDLQAIGDQWKFVNEVNRGRHPYISVAPSPDRLSTIMNSDEFSKVADKHMENHGLADAAYQKVLDAKKIK
jgi:hypothetical protein